MKKLYIFSFLLILSATNIFTQSGWFWQNPLPQGNTLTSFKFINTTGIAVGWSGIILKTTNSGVSWVNLQHDNSYYYDSFWLSENVGFIVGGSGNGIMKRTTNGGIDWININIGNVAFLSSIYFPIKPMVISFLGNLYRCRKSFHSVKSVSGTSI